MENVTEYQYQPLQGPGAIRLFKLYPSSKMDSDIHGEIVSTTLSEQSQFKDTNPSYPSESPDQRCCRTYEPSDTYSIEGGFTALSYTWGSPDKGHMVFINTRRLAITASLDQALRKLRLSRDVPKLWVDSICINQNDDEERAGQVQRMCEIYKTATSTIIYLGPATELSTACFQSAITSESASMQTGMEEFPEREPEDFRLGGGHQKVRTHREGRKEILGRSWFTRAWTFQEAVVSRRLWVCCGTICLPWSQLCTYFLQDCRWELETGTHLFNREYRDWYDRSRVLHLYDSYNMIVTDPWHVDTVLTERNCIVRDSRSGSLRITIKGLLVMDKTRQIYQAGLSNISRDRPEHSLLSILEHRQGFGATDPRDVIFSLYGVLDEGHEPAMIAAPINYRQPVNQLFTQIASAFLATDEMHSYKLFSHVENGRNSATGLPSWVPYWATMRKYEQSIRGHILERKAWAFHRQTSSDVKWWNWNRNRNEETQQALEKYLKSHAVIETDCKIYTEPNSIACRGHSRVSRIIRLSNSSPNVHEYAKVCLRGVNDELIINIANDTQYNGPNLLEKSIEGTPEDNIAHLFYPNAACITGRRVAQLDDERFALVPEQARIGDTLCTFLGAHVFFAIHCISDADIEARGLRALDEKILADFECRVKSLRHCRLVGEAWTTGFESLLADEEGFDTGFVLH